MGAIVVNASESELKGFAPPRFLKLPIQPFDPTSQILIASFSSRHCRARRLGYVQLGERDSAFGLLSPHCLFR
jgi:hypothetical protein